jgi:hypothetical protein
MDTTWFAIDRDGHVAVFDSGEAGAVPTAAYLGEDYRPIEQAVVAAGTGQPASAVAEDEDPDDRSRALAAAGAYLYAHGEASENWIAGPYDRTAVPATPLTADRLPPDVLDNMARFPGRFAETAALQPVEQWPVESWGPTYLAADGATVRCLPGREAEFAAAITVLPDDARATYRIEAPASTAGAPEAKPAARPRWWHFWKR